MWLTGDTTPLVLPDYSSYAATCPALEKKFQGRRHVIAADWCTLQSDRARVERRATEADEPTALARVLAP
jgi:hypothetical protein